MLYYENKAKKQGFSFVIGVDEVGRGPLAGPVVACAVKLKSKNFKNYINDSKKLSPTQRESAYFEIIKKAIIGFGIINETVIDEINILNSTRLAMEQAVLSLIHSFKNKMGAKNIIVIVDGNIDLNLPYAIKNVIKADLKSLSVACASIAAKVIRDRIMCMYSKIYPDYGFAAHKGYGTQRHIDILHKKGPCPIHRLSFAPLKPADDR